MHTFLNRSFVTKLVLGLTLLTISSLTVAVQAMPAVQSDEEIIAAFIAEARDFGLAFKLEDVKVEHTADGTTATALLNAPWSEDAAAKGVDIAFSYIYTSGSQSVPNGYYKLHLKHDATTQTLEFLDKDSKPVAVMKGTQPVSTIAGRTIWIIFVGLWGQVFWEEFNPGPTGPALHLDDRLQKATPTPPVPRLSP
ncbi:MAG TPA: hypothetical protein VGD69_17845 [Herpetosiphonaceae bacterium]